MDYNWCRNKTVGVSIRVHVYITVGAETKLWKVNIRVQVYNTVGAETALMEGA